MAKITFKAGEEYAKKLSRLAGQTGEILKKALYEATDHVADKVRANLEALPEEKFHYLTDGDIFRGISRSQKADLLAGFGITPIRLGWDGWWTVKIGFEGYGRFPTKTYPRGVPNPLLARAVESGSSWRIKTPFVRPAVSATKKDAVAAMERVIDEEIERIMGG